MFLVLLLQGSRVWRGRSVNGGEEGERQGEEMWGLCLFGPFFVMEDKRWSHKTTYRIPLLYIAPSSSRCGRLRGRLHRRRPHLVETARMFSDAVSANPRIPRTRCFPSPAIELLRRGLPSKNPGAPESRRLRQLPSSGSRADSKRQIVARLPTSRRFFLSPLSPFLLLTFAHTTSAHFRGGTDAASGEAPSPLSPTQADAAAFRPCAAPLFLLAFVDAPPALFLPSSHPSHPNVLRKAR